MLIAIGVFLLTVVAIGIGVKAFRKLALDRDLSSSDYHRVARAALSSSAKTRAAAVARIRSAPLPESAGSLVDVIMRLDFDYDSFYPVDRLEEKSLVIGSIIEVLVENNGAGCVDALLSRLETVVFGKSFKYIVSLLNEEILKRTGSTKLWRRLLILRLTHHLSLYFNPLFGIGRREALDLSRAISSVILDEDDLQALIRMLKRLVEVHEYDHYGVSSYERDHYAEPIGKRAFVDYDKVVEFLKQGASDSKRLRELIEAELEMPN